MTRSDDGPDSPRRWELGSAPARGGASVDSDGQLRFARYQPEIYGQLGNGVEWWISYVHTADVFIGETLVSDRGPVDVGGSWTEWLRAGAGGSSGTGALYVPLDPRVGWQNQAWGEVALQPVPGLTGTFTGTFEDFLIDGVSEYRGWVGRGKLELFASRKL